MLVRAHRVAVRILGAGLMAFCAVTAQAAVVNEVRIESVPSEAEVFLLQGTKRTLLGTTPLKTELEFHSDVSILRLAVSKRGFETRNTELGATQKRIVVTLGRRGYTASPDSMKNESLRDVQRRIAKKIDQEMSSLTSTSAGPEWEPGGAIRVENLDGQIYLMVPVALDASRRGKKAADSVEGDEARALWDRVAVQLVRRLGEVTLQERAIQGMIVDVTFGQLRQQFAVGSQVESRMEMQCVPGTETVSVYESCARYVQRSYTDSYGVHSRQECEAGNVTRTVFNPCLSKTPVTVSEVRVDPQASTKKVQTHLQFVVTSKAIERLRGGKEIFPDVGYARSDDSGRIIERKGPLPSALSGTP